jgi:hypothetical protein
VPVRRARYLTSVTIPTTRVLDAFAIAWTALWILIGFLVFHEVSGLASLSDTIVLSGHALDTTASALSAVSHIPVIGGEVGDLAQRAHLAAESAVTSGEASRGDIRNLAILLWIAIAAAPTTPLLVLYGVVRGRLRTA